jgi:hypothetical protein
MKNFFSNKTFARILLLLTIVLLYFGFDTWVKQRDRQSPGTNEQYYRIVPMPIPDSLSFAGEKVPLEMFYVTEALDRELAVNTYWHSSTLQLIRKSTRWFPMFDTILEKYNVPTDFKYLCVAESGLSHAVSPAGAVGFWQFMKPTAKEYNLEVNKEIDERYHVLKSTEAACQYLLDSYEKYGNWTLVAASYNAGRNGISRRMQQQEAGSYYDLILPDETSRYIYRILAIKLIFEQPEEYGFYVEEDDYYRPIPVKSVEVSGKVDSWGAFANNRGLNYKLLKYFNPWLRQTYLKNRKKKTYILDIPVSPYDLTYEKVLSNENQNTE